MRRIDAKCQDGVSVKKRVDSELNLRARDDLSRCKTFCGDAQQCACAWPTSSACWHDDSNRPLIWASEHVLSFHKAVEKLVQAPPAQLPASPCFVILHGNNKTYVLVRGGAHVSVFVGRAHVSRPSSLPLSPAARGQPLLCRVRVVSSSRVRRAWCAPPARSLGLQTWADAQGCFVVHTDDRRLA